MKRDAARVIEQGLVREHAGPGHGAAISRVIEDWNDGDNTEPLTYGSIEGPA